MMQTHPAIAVALADEHRRTLMAEAESARLTRAARAARAARDGRDGRDVSAVRPTRWFLPLRHPGPPPAAQSPLTTGQ
jgi:hypothetical protein